MRPKQQPSADRINPDQYLEILAENGVPLPPDEWRNGADVFTKNMEVLTIVQFPISRVDMQGRVVNTTRQQPPAFEERRDGGETTRDYFRSLTGLGFPPEAFINRVSPPLLEAAYVKGRRISRRMGQLTPPPDGQLTVAIRTENSRPDTRRQR